MPADVGLPSIGAAGWDGGRAVTDGAGSHSEYAERLPTQLTRRQEKITGIAFNPAQPSTVVLTSVGFVCAVDLEKVP